METMLPYIERLVDKLGVPMALLILGILSVARIARWTAPRADQLKDRHFALLDAMTQFANDSKPKIHEIHSDVREIKGDVKSLRERK